MSLSRHSHIRNPVYLIFVLVFFTTACNQVKTDKVAASKKLHKVVIQVSSADPKVQRIALNNAVNLQKRYGVENIRVEIVAYGPGLSLLFNPEQKKYMESLSIQKIKFSACSNTIRKFTKKKGKEPELTAGVAITPSGAARVIELQEQGYAYIRP